MTQEEKAQAYDEAIKQIKECIPDENGFITIYPQEIFLELKELEDERIREWIKKELESKYVINNIVNNVMADKALAWLEKQGKNNMGISESTKQKLEDNLNKALEKETPESWNKFLEEQEEQNPDNKDEPKFKVKYAGSEYNVLEIKDINGITYYGIEDEPNHIDYVRHDHCEIVRGYVWFPNPTYWSEEDEDCANSILRELKQDKEDSPEYSVYFEGLIDWFTTRFKSLIPYNGWKPSDEQITWLYRAADEANKGSRMKQILNELLFDLKKLRGE